MKLHHILYRDFGLILGNTYCIHDEYGNVVLRNVCVKLQGQGEDMEVSLHYAENGDVVEGYNNILAMLDARYFYAKQVLSVEIKEEIPNADEILEKSSI